ncbi:MAG TPA: PD-(D/E)XK nuclease family protein [Pyrinomonadaceae bacterium]|nr:PD-(D/E)XK nuclease family protein [Pyrinomonadaceae bacterium]
MSKEIWLGPVLGNKRERLLARCAEYVAKGHADRLLYIAASHPLLDLVTEKLLDGKQAHGVWGEFPIYLFRGLVRRILSSAILSEAQPSGSPDTSGLLTRGLLTRAADDETGKPLAPRVAIDREELPLRRSLISQIIKQLSTAGKLKAIRPLANRDGCVNTIASLIGELQRAGKTPEEFRKVVEEREADLRSQVSSLKSQVPSLKSQLDFDREVALIYSAYVEALDRFGLTDEDADQLRALEILRGEVNGRVVSLPWLETIDLLVLDGFFDFTPVQGEILRCLIPTIPNVIVNLNHDQRNLEIFQPFQSTIEQLKSIAAFDVKIDKELAMVEGDLAPLRERLFNSTDAGRMPAVRPQDAGAPRGAPIALLLECSDRETEIRSIAREIKSLVLKEGYKLSDIALVVRERSSYADTILRVCADESIPCNLERRVEASHVPVVRACGKLFQLLKEPAREDFRNPKAGDIAHLLKTDYFRVSPEDLPALSEDFDNKYASLLSDGANKDSTNSTLSESKLRAALGIGRWSPDILENVIAYVGSELRIDGWVARAHRLLEVLPSAEAARQLIAGNDGAEEDSASMGEEPPPDEAPVIEKRKKPVPVHPAAIAWTTIVLRHMQRSIADLPENGEAEELRVAIASLLDRFDFPNQVRKPFRRAAISPDIPRAALDIRGLEGVRRAIAATVRSFKYAAAVVSETRASARATGPSLTVGLLTRIALSSFIDEVERCLRSQVLAVGAANRDGLRVLEATDVRGLRFRAVFIAGMVEGGFPLRASRDWLYPHEERERLKKYGVVLEDISTDTLLKEEHYFYQAACRATDRLYLSRPLATADGNETVASYYLEELSRAIAPAKIETRQIRGDVDTHDVLQSSTAAELAVAVIRQDERHKHLARGEHLLPRKDLEQLHSRARSQGIFSESASRRVDIERARNGAWFGPFDGEITSADLRAMLGRHFGSDFVHSASGLSVYGNCSYRFFANRVLRLEPRSEAALDLTALDAGKLLHDILRRFFEQHRRQYLPSLDADELRRELAEVADRVFDEHERLVPPLNPRIWEIDREIRKLILDQVLLYELRLQERTDKRGIRPAYFELAFGRASQAADAASLPDYLKLERSDAGAAETALVQGQIDRVDVNEDERVAVAYDYKLSQGAKLDDIESGRQVQIPIYLAALEQLFLPGFTLAGGGYYRLRGTGSRLNQGLYRSKFADCTSVTSSKTKLDDIEWNRIRSEVGKRVWQFIDGMRGGDFKVTPSLGKTTCKFCDYSAVCRYDTHRISRKRS